MNIQIDKRDKLPAYLQIALAVRARIRSGELPNGSVLPSERAMAQLLGVHRNTVSKAYGELKADGLLRSRQGSGYTVTSPAEASAPREGAALRARGKRVNWASQIKARHLDMDTTFDDLFERAEGDGKISMGGGIAPSGVYGQEALARDIDALIRAKDASRGFFSPYKGDRELRQKLVAFLSTKGIRASAGEIQVLREANQALSYLVMLLLKPGDTVLTEEPVSPDVYRTVELAGGTVCGVPMDADGVDCDILEDLVRRRQPRFLYLNSSFHDPTGVALSAARRRRIMEISNVYRVPVVEEDAASELVYEGEGVPPIKALDTLENVIYIYSFSLTFVPGLSLALVSAGKPVVDSLSYLVSLSMSTPDWITQKLMASYLGRGDYYARLDALRAACRSRRDAVCEKLDAMAHLGVRYTRPRGGVYVWCRLPEGVDGKLLAERAYSRGVTVMPGHVFYPNKKEGRGYIRVNYSHESEERLRQGMDILRDTLKEFLKDAAAAAQDTRQI